MGAFPVNFDLFPEMGVRALPKRSSPIGSQALPITETRWSEKNSPPTKREPPVVDIPRKNR
jgi:hypothetical protein